MTRLSKREYFLISVLVVVLIWFLGWNQAVRPQRDRLKEAGERLAQLEVRREQMALYLDRVPEPEETSAAGNGAAAGTDFFYLDLDDVEIDRLLLQMASESGVDIRRMEIGDPVLIERKLPGSKDLVYTGLDEVPLRYIQVGMELESETFDQIAAMAEQVYRVEKSVVTDQLEAGAVYDRDASGNPEFQGVQCTMNVSFYYIESLELEGDSA